ncbi:MAG: hypothetical protein NTW86_17915 [Candidatus Sumerlaeota bacterium]|nr:hypothetical protein [Candidatus Sumerlaeota bacterium]
MKLRAAIPKCAALSLILAGLCLMSGCAWMKPENRVLLNKLEENVKPKSTVARVALAPAAFVGGYGATAVDTFVIHPVRVAPKAADDVYQLYWKKRDWDLLRRMLFLPPVVVLTPPTFLVDWAVRSIAP